MELKKRLKSSFVFTIFLLLIVAATLATSTFAWYVYQTGVHTTNLRMAVGTGATLQISDEYDGDYGTTVKMAAFTGTLNPVSTDQIRNGFQKVYGFTNGSDNQPALVANLFGKVESSDFYRTTLFVRATGDGRKVYLSDIAYEDGDKNFPISSAVRVGFVVHEPGKDKPIAEEFVFQINKDSHEKAEYNTWQGEEGYVLDSTRTDGTVVKFDRLLDESNYCSYNDSLGQTEINEKSKALFSVAGNGSGGFGEAVQVDVYIWLEGCDRDCTKAICGTTLKNLALSFACETN